MVRALARETPGTPHLTLGTSGKEGIAACSDPGQRLRGVGMKFLRWALALLCLFVALRVAWEFRPYPKIDRAKVYPPLLALREPLVSRSFYYADGGTVGIAIKDAGQSELLFSFPSDYRDDSGYSKLFAGALRKQSLPMTEISPMEPTAEYLRQLLRGRVDDPNIAFAVSCLDGRGRDRLRVMANKLLHGKTPKVYLY